MDVATPPSAGRRNLRRCVHPAFSPHRSARSRAGLNDEPTMTDDIEPAGAPDDPPSGRSIHPSIDETDMTKTTPEQNKAIVLEAFETLFNKRDYAAAERFWSDHYIQHSAHIAPGRTGLFDLIRAAPETLRYENQLIVAEGDYVITHGRFSGNGRPAAWIAADVVRFENGKLAEHWDVLQDETTQAESVSGLPMFGNRFPPDRLIARRDQGHDLSSQRTMPLDLDAARKLVTPIYDALTRPGDKNVEALIKSVTSADFQSCSNEGECVDQAAAIARFKALASVVPDLNWTIKELFVSGGSTIIVRGEAAGTPIKTFLGAEPTGRSFRTMSIDLYTVTDARISRSYHVENWTAALRQLAKD
jgi:predicted SnoaL-like aldol condensation-catalyzing enzyme